MTSPSNIGDRSNAIVALEDTNRKLEQFEGKLTQTGYHRFSLRVEPRGADGYDVSVDAFELGWAPAAVIYAGQDPANTGIADRGDKLSKIPSVFQATEHFPKSLLISAGLSSTEPTTPFGLLMINSKFFSPFNFAKKNENIKYSGVLCIDKVGQIFIYDSKNYLTSPSRISADCTSALKAFPIIVDYSRAAIGWSETNKDRLRRVVVGIDKRKRRYVLVFRDPINLYAVAEFLTRGKDPRLPIAVTKPLSANAISALEAIRQSRQAINLPGADGAIVAAESKLVIGNPLRPLTAILVVPSGP